MSPPDLWGSLRQGLIQFFTDARVLLVAWITIPMWVIWAPDGWLAPGLVAGAAFALLGVWAELAEPVPYQDEEVDSR